MQNHRGPDDNGSWMHTSATGDRIGLASARLSILDLSSAGHMPMSTSDGRYTIAYNGEVYNYPVLRKQLEQIGYQFRSNSDTEAVLYMYQEYGVDSVKQLNGMFALAIWDDVEQRMFMARDHFGIKPFYYTQINNQLAFASELKSLTCLPDFEAKLNFQSLHQYLTFLWVPEPNTMLQDVYKLPAGHYAVWKNGQLETQQYWTTRYPLASEKKKHEDDSLAEQVRERFSEVVKSQMQSDVPLGAFLSAGLDSSSIVACMAQHTHDPIRTYTITFPKKYRRGESTIDDPEVAARTAEHFGCIHEEILVDPDVVSLLPKLVWHMDDPTSDPALLTAYLVNKSASKDVTVLLSGVGGDELFGGYRKYQAQQLAKQYRRIPKSIRTNAIEPIIKALPSFRGTPLKGTVRLAKKFARSGSLLPSEQFIADSVYMNDAMKHSLYTQETQQRIGSFAADGIHRSHFESVSHSDFLNQMLHLDNKMFMPSLNLNYNDKMSMAASVETRVPFLDWEFADWVNSEVHPTQKIRGNTTKYILREAMRPWLPEEVMTQSKAGFYAPIDYWLSNELKPMIDEHLSADTIQRRGLFDVDFVQSLIQQQRSGRQDWSMQLWQLLTLELWMQAFDVQTA